jgi:class 3 adenylate cyclase
MLSSKEILERTGISRATLNNYIAAGLVARPEVLPPNPEDGGAPRIGYFPDDTVDRIETIQRLKGEGWSLARILQFLEGHAAQPAPPHPPAPSPTVMDGVPDAPSDSPQMMVVAVLAVTLHDADSLWVALSVHDYFALTHEVAGEVRRIVSARRGEVMRVAPHRFVCRFLPRSGGDHLWNALEAADAVRESVREVSGRWKLRRAWDMEVLANAGLCEGESWVSTSPQDDVQIVGETLDDAQQLAQCARPGSVLVTRSLIGRLPEQVRGQIVYGVPSAGQREGAPARPMTFAQLREFARGFAPAHGIPRRVAALPVTEIVQLRPAAPATEWKEAQ